MHSYFKHLKYLLMFLIIALGLLFFMNNFDPGLIITGKLKLED